METHRFKKGISWVVMLAFAVTSAACGTILYPERKGQKAGNLDPTIVILDAIGLLFFIIPGVIAFAVDFSNGTIYLPPENHSACDPSIKLKDMLAIKTDKARLTEKDIEILVNKYTGKSIDLSDPNVKIAYSRSNS